jgi:hypothetical protein
MKVLIWKIYFERDFYPFKVRNKLSFIYQNNHIYLRHLTSWSIVYKQFASIILNKNIRPVLCVLCIGKLAQNESIK